MIGFVLVIIGFLVLGLDLIAAILGGCGVYELNSELDDKILAAVIVSFPLALLATAIGLSILVHHI